MKTASKVFIIIGCVLGSFMIYPLIIGIFAYDRIDRATKKSELTGWAIAVLILVSRIGGICMLLLTDNDFSDKQPMPRQDITADSVQSTAVLSANENRQTDAFPTIKSSKNAKNIKPAVKSDQEDVFEGLIRLKGLLDDGLITEEIYLQKKAQYLDRL